MRFARHNVHLQLIPIPSTRIIRRPARTMQNPFIPTSGRNRDEVGPVLIRTETDEVPRAAPRTLHAMSDATSHGSLCHRNARFAPWSQRQNPSPDLSEIDGKPLDVRGPQCRALDVCGPHSAPRLHRLQCSPKTSRLRRRVGYHRQAIPISDCPSIRNQRLHEQDGV
jgi:hypothetical protein